MSDLIEKIRKCANMPCMDMEGNPDPNGYRSGMWITAEDADQILSALETVWGIEELSKCGFVRIENGIMNRWYVTTNREWRRSDQQETDGPTLSAAIEAARKGM